MHSQAPHLLEAGHISLFFAETGFEPRVPFLPTSRALLPPLRLRAGKAAPPVVERGLREFLFTLWFVKPETRLLSVSYSLAKGVACV